MQLFQSQSVSHSNRTADIKVACCCCCCSCCCNL